MESERKLGIEMGCYLSTLCNKFIVVQERGRVLTPGMLEETSNYFAETGRKHLKMTFKEFEDYCYNYKKD